MVAAAMPVTDDQRQELQRIAASSVLPHRQVVQAQALLWASDGVANEEIARRSRVDSDAVQRWRKRFTDKGIDGVGEIAKGRGQPSPPPGERRPLWRRSTSTPWSPTPPARAGPADRPANRSRTHSPR